MYLSFVLLPRPYDAQGAPVVAAFARLFPQVPCPLAPQASGDIAELRDHDGRVTFVALMPAPVPNGEADAAASRSMAAFSRKYGPPPPHVAHLVVTTQADASPASLLQHTRVVAAAASAYGAIAIYEGNAGATHPTEFYLDVVTSDARPLMVWTGISIAQQGDRTSILTLGLHNMLGIPDLLVSAGKGRGNDALMFAFDMASYVIGRGEPLPDGDTVGRTAEEKIRVRYVASPIDPARQVVQLDLP